jgi:phenylacetate-CoA ligase
MLDLLSRLSATAYMAYHRIGQSTYAFKSLAKVLADQTWRVRRMVAYAYRYVPYYHETMDRLGLRPVDFRTADDLAKFPILERDQLQHDPAYFASTTQPLSSYLAMRNSGSMGKPCTFYHDARGLFQDAAYGERARAVIAPLIGKSVGYRITTITRRGGTTFGVVKQFYRDHALIPPGINPRLQELSLLDPPELNVRLINEFKPEVIETYGSYLAMLFAHIKATGQPFYRPEAIRYTSDPVPESARRLIEEEFHIPVFSRYEAAEVTNIGFECEEHSGLHINVDLCPIRIVGSDGKTLPPGESGDVLISNLINCGTVLLNYRIGDVATFLPGRCPCGRSLPLLSQLEGRLDDYIELPSGRRIHPMVLPSIFKPYEGIWQYQVVQDSGTHFTVSMVADATLDRRLISEKVSVALRQETDESVQVDVRFVDAIPRTPGGKVRPVISLQAATRLGLAQAGPADAAGASLEGKHV